MSLIELIVVQDDFATLAAPVARLEEDVDASLGAVGQADWSNAHRSAISEVDDWQSARVGFAGVFL